VAAVDAWAGASMAIDSDDVEAPPLVARACEALLGVTI
jgi:L-cysteine:1D-myo-inositol 2-amino-2-deoxy-alpha-D-glucopyranoside ligase